MITGSREWMETHATIGEINGNDDKPYWAMRHTEGRTIIFPYVGRIVHDEVFPCEQQGAEIVRAYLAQKGLRNPL